MNQWLGQEDATVMPDATVWCHHFDFLEESKNDVDST